MDENSQLTKDLMIRALTHLDKLVPRPLQLIVGGGGALLLTDLFPLATADIDAIPKGMGADELGDYVKAVAKELNISGDWLNPYYSTFTHVLPADFSKRMQEVFRGKMIVAMALGKEDMLIMKCFAHRKKDIPHARSLVRAGADVDFVSRHMESLRSKNPQTQQALDFLDDILIAEEGE